MLFGNKLSKIEKYAQKGNADKLKGLVHDKKEDVRLAAIDGLGRCKDEVAFNTLSTLMNDPDAKVRLHVVKAMGATGDPKVREFLEHRREVEKDTKVLAAINESCKSSSSMKTST